MKIIECSNFDRDNYPEKVIASGIEGRHAAIMCAALVRKLCADHTEFYFRVVEDDYVLQKGFEP